MIKRVPDFQSVNVDLELRFSIHPALILGHPLYRRASPSNDSS